MEGPSTSAPQLHRKLGLLNATSINMSNMIGIGPFITVPLIISTMGGPQALTSWFVGAILAIADGLVISELGAALPGSGGTYSFLKGSYGQEKWGRLMAWMFAWEFLFFGPLEIASGTIGMTQYMSFLWKGLARHPWEMRLMAASIAVLVVITLYRKINDVAKLMLVLWVAALVTTGWVIITGLAKMNTHLAFSFPAGAFNMNWSFLIGLGSGTIIVIYNYLGYYQVCYLGDEVKQPERTVPYAVIISILAVTAIDFLLSFSFISVVPWKEMIRPGSPANLAVASVFIQKIYGHWAAVLLTALILCTAFGSIYALMLGYSRIPYAAARDKLFFPWFDALHPTGEFPHRSLLLVGALSVLASLFNLAEVIVALMVARILVQFVGHTIGLFVYRKEHADTLPFKMWLYPLPAIVALIGWVFVFGSPAFQPGGWKYMMYAAVTIAIGLVIFYFIFSLRRGLYRPRQPDSEPAAR
ncbi:MAG: APC family permease [Terriglobia bacterium]